MSIVKFALASLCFAVAAVPAVAQIASPGASSTGSTNPAYTATNVDPASPFGSVDVTGAGASNASMSAFVDGLTGAQRTDLAARCKVIADPANSSTYQQNTRDFCRSFTTVASSTNLGAAGGASGSSGPGITGPGNGPAPGGTAGTGSTAAPGGPGNAPGLPGLSGQAGGANQ